MAKKKRKRIASRGSVNNIILKTLVNGDKYGYEIIKEVEEYSDGKIKLKQPSLYSSLTRFEEKDIVSSYWGDSDIGGRRHYYHLTDKGKIYYNKCILKISDEEIDDNNSNITKEDAEQTISTTEIDDSAIPSIVNFNIDNKTNTPEEISDHNFHNVTPIEKAISSSNTIDSRPIANSEQNEIVDNSYVWKELSDRVKLNNKKCAISNCRRLHYIKPKKSQKVILDSDGIYKLRDLDYTPTRKVSIQNKKIIDNVGKRLVNDNLGYTSYTETSNKPRKIEELSDEERKRRNEIFLEKFNAISQSKMKEVQPKPEPIQENIIEKDIDYRSKLDLFSDNSEPAYNVSPETTENNLFNYIEESEDNHDSKEDEDDKFVNFDPVDFEVKSDNKKYVEEISNYTTHTEEIKISRYENSSNVIMSDKQYVLINKVRCLFGFILMIMFVLELSIALAIFKNNNMLFDSDKTLFIVAYVVAILISLLFMFPILINPNKHKLNNFNLKYSMIFGILTFLVSIVLIYCINSLCGFMLDNFQYFAIKLIVPTILTFNFVITPPIYSAIIKAKRFYD